ncbi:hypothetical protein I656_00393 [Geobacillus sp. WSUCF1]|nr:hypothetical protein I656_00393 [Geobacillus sp. WSUCF1]
MRQMRPFAPRRRNEFHKAPPFLYTVAVFLV